MEISQDEEKTYDKILNCIQAIVKEADDCKIPLKTGVTPFKPLRDYVVGLLEANRVDVSLVELEWSETHLGDFITIAYDRTYSLPIPLRKVELALMYSSILALGTALMDIPMELVSDKDTLTVLDAIDKALDAGGTKEFTPEQLASHWQSYKFWSAGTELSNYVQQAAVAYLPYNFERRTDILTLAFLAHALIQYGEQLENKNNTDGQSRWDAEMDFRRVWHEDTENNPPL